MLSEFRKFVGFKILEYFLQHPTKKTYLNEIAKELGISARSVKIYCDLFDQDHIIIREKAGNAHFFSTNNQEFRVREMKRAYNANLLAEYAIEDITKSCISMALFGSFASGNHDEQSDIDILIIGDEHDINKDKIVTLMNQLHKEIQLTVLSLTQWETMKKKDDPLVRTILRNHILIKGVDL